MKVLRVMLSHLEEKARGGKELPTLVIHGEYVEIPLGGQKGKTAFVSREDAARVLAYKWWPTLNSTKGRNGTRKEKWYAQARVDGKQVYLHRFIQNFPVGLVVDHIDGNGLNCTRSNLQNITQAKNVAHCLFRPDSERADPFL